VRFVLLLEFQKKEIGRVFKILEKQINSEEAGFFKGIAIADSLSGPNPTSAEDLMARFCNRLGLSQQIQALTKQLARKAETEGTLAGRSPISIAAAGIYMMSALFGNPKSAREIAEIAGVSDSTIRNAYKYLYAERHNLIEERWLQDGKASIKNLPMA